jgi:hypothetical protein
MIVVVVTIMATSIPIKVLIPSLLYLCSRLFSFSSAVSFWLSRINTWHPADCYYRTLNHLVLAS